MSDSIHTSENDRATPDVQPPPDAPVASDASTAPDASAASDASAAPDAAREAAAEGRPFLESLVDLGAEWAALGISFGVQALDRSARSLKLASKTLALVSRKIEESRPRAHGVAEEEERREHAA